MDIITIKDLEVFYQVGITETERARPQRLLLTLEMEHDVSAAVAGDDLAETVDYDALSQRLLVFAEGRHWRLIETLAADIAALVQEEFSVRRVRVEVKKFCIPQAAYVSVHLTRPTA